MAGVAGEAPYRIEMQLRAVIDDGGDVTLLGEFERDLRLSPRFVVQPRVELRIGRGNDELDGELRGRFEISPRIAPYVGIAWQHRFDGRRPDRPNGNSRNLVLVLSALSAARYDVRRALWPAAPAGHALADAHDARRRFHQCI